MHTNSRAQIDKKMLTNWHVQRYFKKRARLCRPRLFLEMTTRMHRRFILPVLLLFCAVAAHAAPRPYWHTTMVHKSWAKRDGAPTGVYGVAQDARGMLWFASSDGLYRFDGVRFERRNTIDGNVLRSPNVNALLAVGTALWVGYAFDGVSVFDQGKVRHYGIEQGVPAGVVYKLARTKDGTMWLSNGAGLYWLDGAQWRLVHASDGLPAGGIHYFTDLPEGSILANLADGIYRSTPGSHRFRKVAGGKDMEIHMLLANGDALVVDAARQFSRYAAQTNTLTPVVFPPDVKPLDPFLDERGALWVNTAEGLTLLDAHGQTLHTFSGANSMSGKQIFTAFDDREGNLWLTTENGIDMIRESRLSTLPLPPRMFRGLSVQAGGDGTLWVGNRPTDGDYVASTFGLRPDGTRVDAPMQKLSASLRAPDGSMWFGNDAALWHYNAGQWQTWPLPAPLRGNDVQTMAIDSAGRLWVAVVKNGVSVFDNGQWQPGGCIAALAKRTPISLHADGAGRMWFGYPGNRLAVLDQGALREYGAPDGLHVGNVSAMTTYRGHLLAAGDQGVSRMTGHVFSALQDAQGQPLRGAAAMLISRGGDLWLHGADGLARASTANLETGGRLPVDRFDYLDGYEGKPSQVRPLAVLAEGPDGRIWYASSIQVGWVDPARVARNPLAPAPQVTALRTDQRSYDAMSALVLPKYTRNLELGFTAATLGVPERARFRYRLAGLETTWRDGGVARVASYSNLGPGDFRFEVLAANEDGVWSPAPATLAFTIVPAFVQTIWFKFLCGVLVLALASLLYWRRVALVTARVAERLRERVRERERIARTLHDNFLQSVQALMMQFSLIQHELAPGDPVQAKIDTALHTADDVLREGREQVLALRLHHELSGDLEAALSSLGQILAPRHKARFGVEATGTTRPLRADAASEAYAIGREALLNAFRHAGSAEVTLVLQYAPQHFTLTVRDGGRGISAAVQARGHLPGHYGLTGMRERAQDVGGTLDIVSTEGAGTTVTLRLPARRAYAPRAADKLPRMPS
jgi:signal transduction histidine kinase/ligand-binding sensor domain-containing protein